MVNLPFLIELLSRFNTSGEKKIHLSITSWCSPKEKSDFPHRNSVHITVDKKAREHRNNTPGKDEYNGTQDEEKEEFTQHI